MSKMKLAKNTENPNDLAEKTDERVHIYKKISISKRTRNRLVVFIIVFVVNYLFYFNNGMESVRLQSVFFIYAPSIFATILYFCSLFSNRPDSQVKLLMSWLIFIIISSACFIVPIRIFDICYLFWQVINK
jgi:hypothetical protein